VTAIATHADAIVTFNVKDFAAAHLKDHLQIEVIHPDDFVLDLHDGESGRKSEVDGESGRCWASRRRAA
jgi:hypothetical protein